ncbi:tyrosine-type recombinase/integrase, partial [Thioalkalivibrio sp. ALE23]
TQALYLSALRGVLKETWHQRLIDGDEYHRIVDIRPYKEKRLPKGRALESDEIDHLLKKLEASDHPSAIRDRAIINVLYSSGMRRAELVGLDLDDLCPEAGGLRIRGKGNRERIAPVDDEAWESVNTWIDDLRGEESGPLFLPMTKAGKLKWKRMTGQGVAYLLEKASKKAGTERTLPHDMRRTFITHLLDNNEDILTVADLAGHASVETTQIYDRRGEATKRAAVERLRKDRRRKD